MQQYPQAFAFQPTPSPAFSSANTFTMSQYWPNVQPEMVSSNASTGNTFAEQFVTSNLATVHQQQSLPFMPASAAPQTNALYSGMRALPVQPTFPSPSSAASTESPSVSMMIMNGFSVNTGPVEAAVNIHSQAANVSSCETLALGNRQNIYSPMTENSGHNAAHSWHSYKRRSSSDEEESDEEQPPAKQCITEERMMAQMHRLSLQTNALNNSFFTTPTAATSDQLGSSSVGQIWEPIDEETLDTISTSPPDESSVHIEQIDYDEDDNYNDDDEHATKNKHTTGSLSQTTFHFTDEMKQMMRTDDILSRLSRQELAKPSQALILWEPPIGYLPPLIKSNDRDSETSVVIEELPDDYCEENDAIEMGEAITDYSEALIQDIGEEIMFDDEEMDL